MRDNNANVNGVDTLDAGQFNVGRDEVQNAVEASGQTLDPKDGPDTNTSMLAGAMTESSQTADFYNDGGAVNAYVLTGVGSWVQPLAYRDGMAVRFVPGNTNTGATTVNVAGLGVKAVTFQNGTALTSGELTTATLSQLFFDDSNDRFYIAPWVTATGNIDASQVVSGILALARIPNIPASKTTSGIFATARLPAATLTAKGTVEKATAAEMTAGTNDKFPDADDVKGFMETVLSSARYIYTTANNTAGPSYASGSWVTILLGTEDYDPNSIGSISSNRVTLAAGTYQIAATSSAKEDSSGSTQWRMRVRDITGSSTLLTSSTSHNSGGGAGSGGNSVFGVITLSVTTAIELQLYSTGALAAGVPVNTGDLEMWNTLSITRIRLG